MVPPSPTTEINIEGETIHGETSTIQNNNAEISTKGEPVEKELSKEIRAAIIVIAILVTTVTYQAALNPPGGFWQDDSKDDSKDKSQSLPFTGHGDSMVVQQHTAGYPVMATKSPLLYGFFVGINAAAFVTSFIVMAFIFLPELQARGLRFETFLLHYFLKWMNIPSRSTSEDEQQNFPNGRNISSNSTAVVDEINHLMKYVGFVCCCLLLASALWIYQHLSGPGLVAFLITFLLMCVFARASVFIPRLYRLYQILKKE